MVRHYIIFKKVHGEKGSAYNVSADELKSNKMAAFFDRFCENDIYSADETDLYYRATPNCFLCYKHVDLNGFKKAMDRITILFCANMLGILNESYWSLEKIESLDVLRV